MNMNFSCKIYLPYDILPQVSSQTWLVPTKSLMQILLIQKHKDSTIHIKIL